jgi:hypothetical protein
MGEGTQNTKKHNLQIIITVQFYIKLISQWGEGMAQCLNGYATDTCTQFHDSETIRFSFDFYTWTLKKNLFNN